MRECFCPENTVVRPYEQGVKKQLSLVSLSKSVLKRKANDKFREGKAYTVTQESDGVALLLARRILEPLRARID